MSRRNTSDNSATVSLFPFLAVLLCTMGALLVVLVAVSRNARLSAVAPTGGQGTADIEIADAEHAKKLVELQQYAEKVQRVREEAATKLQEDQKRISQVESHMRNLQDELKKVVLASMELETLEGEHHDDIRQAERERDRLQQLIAEKESEVDKLKQGSHYRKRTYSLVPYEGPNGTTRRPIIIECCQEGIVLQPEGVVIRREDLQPPLGSGNALASAIRAAREHYLRQHPEEGKSRDTEPYPMLVIRPEGTELFGLARRAIEAGGFDFGYEPVESHWELNYGVADPVLAKAELQALEQARARQEILAMAAPGMYRGSGSSVSIDTQIDQDSSMGERIGRGGYSRSRPEGSQFGPSLNGAYNDDMTVGSGTIGNGQPSADRYASGGGRHQGTGMGEGGPNDVTGMSASPDGMQPANSDNSSAMNGGSGVGGGSSQPPPPGTTATASGMAGSPSSSNSMGGTTPENTGIAASSGLQSGTTLGGSPNDFDLNSQPSVDLNQKVVPNWSRPRTNVRAVAVRRPIRVIVREDHASIISDETRSQNENLTGRMIKFEDNTIDSMQEFVKAIEKQVDGWGIAGNNLYWKPVLELQFETDGQRRADDMARLLKNSDVEVRLPATASNAPQGATSAPR